MKLRALLLISLTLLTAWGPAHSSNLPDSPAALPALQVTAWMGAPASADLPDVMNQAFTPVRMPLARAPSAAVTWLRVEVPAGVSGPAVLLARPQQLDDLRIYRQQPDGRWQATQAGDRSPYSLRERGELYPAFNLELSADRSTVVYLRLQTTSAHVINLRLMRPAQASAWDGGLQLGMGLYLGALLIISVSSALRWAVTRDTLWAAGALFQVQSVLFLGCIMGFAARYVWPDQPATADFMTTVLSILNLLLATLFHWVAFRRFSSYRWVVRLQAGILLFSCLTLAIALLGQPTLGLALNNLLMAFTTFFGMLMIFFINPPDRQLRNAIRITYAITYLSATYYTLPLFRLVPLQEFHLFPALLPIGAVVATQFVIALFNDASKAREAANVRLKMQETQLQLASEERQHAHTLHFMGMLLHELKNPLAAIRLAAQSLQRMVTPEPAVNTRLSNIDSAVQSIDLVLERSRDMDRMASSNSPLRQQDADLHALAQDWVARCGQAQRVALQDPAPGHTVQTDPMLLGLMVNNLLDNALKYSPPESPVELNVTLSADTTHQGKQRLCIWVRNAVGRAGKPDPTRLFSKYYRADTAQYLSGTGLGLSWVHGTASQAGGEVRYLPEDGHIVFELTLPC